MKRCYCCNIDLEDNLSECPSCKSKIKRETEKFCVHCSKVVKKEARVCKYCDGELAFNFYQESLPEKREEEVYSINKKKYYPNFWQSIILFIGMIVTMSIVGVIFGVIGKAFEIENNIFYSWLGLVVATISMFILVFFLARVHKNNFLKKIFSKKINFNFLYTIIPIIIGTMMINIFITNLNLNPSDTSYTDFIKKLASNKLYVSLFIIPIVFIAPVTEELIYRGIILRGLSSHYSAKVAILVSSILFSLAHLNFAQIPNAFILGLVFSILMIHLGNILYVIIYHIINNFLVTVGLYFVAPEDFTKKASSEITLEFLPSLILAILGIILIYIGLKWTIKSLTGKDTTVIPDENTYNRYLNSFSK